MALHFGKRDPEPTKPLVNSLNPQRYGSATRQALGHTATTMAPEAASQANSSTAAVLARCRRYPSA